MTTGTGERPDHPRDIGDLDTGGPAGTDAPGPDLAGTSLDSRPDIAGHDAVPPPLRAALGRLAELPSLLVASDYDGVLAPIVADPARAYPQPAAIAALRGLADLPGTTVALVSGRPRPELARLSGLAAPVRLVGGHGSEFADRVELTAAQAALHRRLTGALRGLVNDYPGVWLETKPTSLVVHTRPASAELGRQAREAALTGPGRWPGVHPSTGKEVVELAVTDADKGTAVVALRREVEADAVLFVGDDVTDENAFAVLDPGRDVGVKVGDGATRAGFRIADPAAATAVLEQLLHDRTPGGSR